MRASRRHSIGSDESQKSLAARACERLPRTGKARLVASVRNALFEAGSVVSRVRTQGCGAMQTLTEARA